MVQMVDSRQHKLNSMEIVMVALENTQSKYPPKVALPAVISEMGQPNTKVQQIGNTMFVAHMTPNGAKFKALNADTAQNFLQNSIEFIRWMKQLGVPVLVTEFSDPNILRMIQMIAANPPFPDMGMQARVHDNNEYSVVISMGGAQ